MIARHYTEVKAEKVTKAEGVSIRVVIGAKEKAPNFVMRVFDVEPGASSPPTPTTGSTSRSGGEGKSVRRGQRGGLRAWLHGVCAPDGGAPVHKHRRRGPAVCVFDPAVGAVIGGFRPRTVSVAATPGRGGGHQAHQHVHIGDAGVLLPRRTRGRINTGWQTKVRALQADVADEDRRGGRACGGEDCARLCFCEGISRLAQDIGLTRSGIRGRSDSRSKCLPSRCSVTWAQP
jgi:hypothetical protein